MTIAEIAPEVTEPRHGIFARLYRGETSFDFVGRKRLWFVISGLVIVAGFASFGVKGLNFSIDFKGGVSWQLDAHNLNVSQADKLVVKAGLANPTVTILGGKTLSVDAKVTGSQTSRTNLENNVADALAKATHVNPNSVSVSFIGPSWGGNISSKAIEALIIFFMAIAAYISLRFEWRMAIAAIVAVLHDLLVTVGIYAISGFQVTPDTVIALLTILGYSLYDTVVVFDRIEENARGIGQTGRLTYSDTVNLSMNQVMMRSVNTSLVAILPILSVLVLGAFVLGATTLQYFGLALFIGLTSGAYSSIFIASPLLAILKEREPRYKSIRRRLESRGGAHQLLSPAEVARSARNAAATSAARRGAVAAKSAAPKRSAGSQRAVIVPGSGSSSGSAIASSAKRDNRASESEIDEDDSDFEDLDPDFTGVLGKSGSSDQEVADGKAESGGSDDTELDDSHVSDQPGGDQGEDSGTDQGEDSGGSSGRVGSGATDPAASGSKTGSSGTPARVPVRPRKKRKR